MLTIYPHNFKVKNLRFAIKTNGTADGFDSIVGHSNSDVLEKDLYAKLNTNKQTVPADCSPKKNTRYDQKFINL